MHVQMMLLNMFRQRSGEVVGGASEEYDMLNSFDPRVFENSVRPISTVVL